MSVEVGVFSTLIKFIWLPFVGLLGWFGKGYFNKLDERLTYAEKKEAALQTKINALELELTRNYYDKQELKDNIVVPLLTDIKETRSELKILSGMLNDIHQDMAILKYKILGDELSSQKSR